MYYTIHFILLALLSGIMPTEQQKSKSTRRVHDSVLANMLSFSHHVPSPVAEAVVECLQSCAHTGWCLSHLNGCSQK